MDNVGLEEGIMFDIDEGLKARAAEAALAMFADGRTSTEININGDPSHGTLLISTETKEGFMVLDTVEVEGRTIYIGTKAK